MAHLNLNVASDAAVVSNLPLLSARRRQMCLARGSQEPRLKSTEDC